MSPSWDVDFGQPLTREADMNLLVDLALDGVNVSEGSGLDIQAFIVPDTLAQTCDYRPPPLLNSCAWMETTAWKSTQSHCWG